MKKVCLYCKKEFETRTKLMYCCEEHKKIHKNLLKFPDGSDYVECKICGCRGTNLYWHIRKAHNISIKEYCIKFKIEEIDLVSESWRKRNSDIQKKLYADGILTGWKKGAENPSCCEEVRTGRKSIFSMNYYGYDGMTDEEKKIAIANCFQQAIDKKEKNGNNPLTIAYYLKRGFTTEQAKEKIHSRQSTFTLKKCIEKYGKDEGERVFKARQEKWQTTLNSKPLEEIERINRAKMQDSRGYSKISQILFNGIFEMIKNMYNEIFFATHGEKDFNEFMVFNVKTGKKYFLDFYVKDNNKVIEFDGDYWHGEKRGNQERDRKREEDLKSMGFTNIFHVKECDYRANPDKILNDCVRFITEA